jgi:hypothetical protein
MAQALRYFGKKAEREWCRWNRLGRGRPSIFRPRSGFTPNPTTPVVFHLHGYDELAESLVLTEDDYLDFLVNISRDQTLLPPVIEEALAGTSLLFIGYGLADWSFRVLFRGLITSTERSLRRISVTIQVSEPIEGEEPTEQRRQEYLDKYFNKLDMRVYWGPARQFCAELRHRMGL